MSYLPLSGEQCRRRTLLSQGGAALTLGYYIFPRRGMFCPERALSHSPGSAQRHPGDRTSTEHHSLKGIQTLKSTTLSGRGIRRLRRHIPTSVSPVRGGSSQKSVTSLLPACGGIKGGVRKSCRIMLYNVCADALFRPACFAASRHFSRPVLYAENRSSLL